MKKGKEGENGKVNNIELGLRRKDMIRKGRDVTYPTTHRLATLPKKLTSKLILNFDNS
jgi:hypothetical protein